jgi:hypothetical protein
MHVVEAIECTGEGRGMPTIASMEREAGGVVQEGVKRERRTMCGGCGREARGKSFDLAVARDRCEEDATTNKQWSCRG